MRKVPDDITFFRDHTDFAALCEELKKLTEDLTGKRDPAGKTKASDDFSRSCTLKLRFAGRRSADPSRPPTGRALACSCFRRAKLSVTWRALVKHPPADPPAGADRGVIDWPGDPVALATRLAPIAATAARADPVAEMTGELVDRLWEALPLRDRTRPLTGLIVIAGRTGSGKSGIAHAFAERYIDHCRKLDRDRPPHLVTFEDPIEKPFATTPEDAASRGFDLTPREKGIDVRNLGDAVRDALRQTPALFYVGETRDPRDWKVLLRFAGTGHLVITTAHAGSLMETMGQIVQAAKVRTPAERSKVAGRIAALVHLRAYDATRKPRKRLIPAIWTRTPRSVSSFTAEGLGSMLPDTRTPGGKNDRPGCLGRAHFVAKLKYLQGPADLPRIATLWDLRGE